MTVPVMTAPPTPLPLPTPDGDEGNPDWEHAAASQGINVATARIGKRDFGIIQGLLWYGPASARALARQAVFRAREADGKGNDRSWIPAAVFDCPEVT
jgi:hypothetical protein